MKFSQGKRGSLQDHSGSILLLVVEVSWLLFSAPWQDGLLRVELHQSSGLSTNAVVGASGVARGFDGDTRPGVQRWLTLFRFGGY